METLSLDIGECLLITARDISQLKAAQAQIQHLPYHDPLTSRLTFPTCATAPG